MKEFKRCAARKRNILYLIENYLKAEGLVKSAQCLQNEADLKEDYVICDNINLETIVIEYETYYYMRFQIYPLFCKRNDKMAKITDKKRSKKEISTSGQLPKSITEYASLQGQKETNKYKDINGCLMLHSDNFLDMSLTVLPALPMQNKNEKKTETVSNYNPVDSNDWMEYTNIISKAMQTNSIRVEWDDIKGLDEAKQVLKEAILYPIKYPHIFDSIIMPWKCILLYGPPGTGKTMLAKAICSKSGAKFFNVSSSVVINKWRGDSEKLIRVLFELANQHAPSVIFIDEIDSLASKRGEHEHEASRRFKSELFTLIDELLHTDKNIFLLATTNLPWDLDEAMIRRFEKQLLINLPNVETREQIFRKHLPEVVNEKLCIKCDINYNYIAELIEGYSGSDIKSLTKEIIMESMKNYFALIETANEELILKHKKVIKNEDVEDALEKIKPSISHLKNKYIKWQLHRSK